MMSYDLHIRLNKRSHDQVDSLPVGHDQEKRIKQQQLANEPATIIQLLSICPHCQGELNEPSTLPCGYTVCQQCTTKTIQKCLSPTCSRVHTTPTKPNFTVQNMQHLMITYETSHSIEALRKAFDTPTECVICSTRFTDPTTTPCGHSFCRNCLTRALDHRRSCPNCREALDFIPPPTSLLVMLLKQLYDEDEESANEHSLNDFDSTDSRVPLLIGSLSFPHVNCVIHIFEPRYRLMLRRIMSSSRRRFAMCLQRRKRTQTDPAFYEYGTMLELMHVQTLQDGRSIVQAVGSHRFKVIRFDLVDGYHMADIERVDDVDHEQEHMLEQQQILKASAMRARSQQTSQPRPQQQSQSQPPMTRSIAGRPMSVSMMRPISSARPVSSARPMARPIAVATQQRTSWAEQAHPQTQQQVNRAPWLQMHVQGLSAARPKPHLQAQQAQPTLPIEIPKQVIKNHTEQSTEELLDELSSFFDRLIQHQQSHPGNSMTAWLNALGDPPALRGPQRDKVIMTWWIANMMPLGEEEKVSLLSMRTVRERTLSIISWVDRFQDQWSLFLNNPNSAQQMSSCCIS